MEIEKPRSKNEPLAIIIHQSEVTALKPYIDEILTTIGHPEALVSDETSLYDFGCFSATIERQLVKTIRSEFGITTTTKESLVSIARKIKESRKK